ncbi:glycosyltransferase family 39 protein [Frondihabitans australicus]|uniref:Glycosyltransferase RgtA/B/C/D-like domain-containing protein n=1 Tax=Frondihabitans australicus TaxID=386892 RepID=A0A495ID55_9MICO|nr:glycosyltransferase family 39 protein [Frondihabitans australicus]RKR73241.1 hypothetical protein C8E83_0331 [Frondihabitans australicus]
MFAVLTAALAALVSLIVGLPWGLVLRRRADDIVDLLSDSVLVGLVLTITGLTMYTYIGWAGLGISVVVELALVAVMVVRRRELGWPRLPIRREWVWIAVLVVILAVALVLRRHTIDFITYTGDMGAYVNWANQFLRTGGFHASWPPLYSVFLAFGGLLTGAKGVTGIIAITGLLLILGAVRVLRLVGVNGWVALIVAGVVAVHPESIWFSQIPLSESLNAPLLVIWLLSIIALFRAERVGVFAWSFVGGVSILALSLLRGTAPILVFALALVAVIALIAPRWRSLAPRLWLLVAANGAGSAIGFWYGVDRIPSYYVTTQIRELLPTGLYSKLVEIGILKATVVSALTLVVVVVVLAAVYALVRRYAPRVDVLVASGGGASSADAGDEAADGGYSVGWVIRAIEVLLALGMLVVVLDAKHRASDVWPILHREAFLLVVVAIVTPILLAVTRHGRAQAALAIVSSLVVIVFVQLQNKRLEAVSVHTTFLYWDRYLYSEFFPAMIVLVGLALGVVHRVVVVRLDPATLVGRAALTGGATPAASGSRLRRQLGVTTVAVAILALVLVKAVLPVSRYIQHDELLLGAGQIETDLQVSMTDTTKPFVWGSTSGASVASSGFPNTWMAYGTPLAVSFGREFANSQHTQPKGDFAPDPVLTAAALDQAMSCTKSDSVYVVESETGGKSLKKRLAGTDLTVSHLTTIRQDVVQLSQLTPMDSWHTASYVFGVYEVSASSVPSEAGTCDVVTGD